MINKNSLTATDVCKILNVTRTALYQHLSKLDNDKNFHKHFTKAKNHRLYFDSYGFTMIAKTFINRNNSKSSKVGISNRRYYHQLKSIRKSIKIINNKIDKIINKLNIHY